MADLFSSEAAIQLLWATTGVVHQKKGAGSLLVVASPYTLAATCGGVVGHAVTEYRAVAKYINHQRHIFACGIFQAGAYAAGGALIANFDSGAVGSVIIVTTNGDGASIGVTVNYKSHNRSGFAQRAIAIKFCERKNAVGADNIGIGNRIYIGRVAKARGQVSAFYITAAQ